MGTIRDPKHKLTKTMTSIYIMEGLLLFLVQIILFVVVCALVVSVVRSFVNQQKYALDGNLGIGAHRWYAF
jgi:hypothetical protein